MKNKKVIYFLIPAVILVWGMVIVKIIRHLHVPDYSGRNNLENNYSGNKDSIEDSSTLLLDYRDPFLNGTSQSIDAMQNQSLSVSENRINLNSTPKPVIIFPFAKYSGMVVNARNKRKLGLFKIENRDCQLTEGETSSGIKVIKLYSDSAILIYKKNRRTFIKS